MVTHKVMPLPNASVGKVLGLIEVLYSYGGKGKISFLSEELHMPIDELGSAIDMSELLGLLKVSEGSAVLTIYGEALSLGTMDDKKKILHKKVSKIEPFKAMGEMLKRGDVREKDFFEKVRQKFPISDVERFHKLFVGWGTYSGLFEYDSKNMMFTSMRMVPQY
jgi:NitT/TauT family transport system ATP-binding protein